MRIVATVIAVMLSMFVACTVFVVHIILIGFTKHDFVDTRTAKESKSQGLLIRQFECRPNTFSSDELNIAIIECWYEVEGRSRPGLLSLLLRPYHTSERLLRAKVEYNKQPYIDYDVLWSLQLQSDINGETDNRLRLTPFWSTSYSDRDAVLSTHCYDVDMSSPLLVLRDSDDTVIGVFNLR